MINLVRFVSVLLIAVGLAMLVYGAMVDPAVYRAPLGLAWLLATPAETLAWGVGAVVAGFLFLMMFGIRPAAMDKPGKP